MPLFPLVLLPLALAACALPGKGGKPDGAARFELAETRISTTAIDEELSWICEAFLPIALPDNRDEDFPVETVRQVAEHNAVWSAVCLDIAH